jgi:NADH-quinone oxidoreductase subunit M
MAQTIPAFTKCIIFFMLANSALPGTSGFVGEFLILQGLYQYSSLWAFVACLSLVTTIAFNLQYMVPFFLEDSTAKKRNYLIADCQNAEHLILAPLAGITLYLGVNPGILFSLFCPITI